MSVKVKPKLTSIGIEYIESYNLKAQSIDIKKMKKINKKLNQLRKKALKIGYLVPTYEVIYTQTDIVGYGFSSYDYESNHNIFQLEVDLIEYCFDIYINDTIVHEFAHMIYESNYEIHFIEGKEEEISHSQEWIDVFIEFGGRQDWHSEDSKYVALLVKNNVLEEFCCSCKIDNITEYGRETAALFYKDGQTYECPECLEPFLPKKDWTLKLRPSGQGVVTTKAKII